MQIPLNKRFWIIAAVAVSLLSPVRAQQLKTSPASHIGQVSIRFGRITGRQSLDQWKGTITRSGGRLVEVSSAQYEMSGQKIDLLLAGKNLKPINVVSTGSAKIVIRNAASNQKTVATCDKAVFTSTRDPKDRGKVNLLGHFRMETTSPGFTAPSVIEATNGTIEFLENGEISFDAVDEDGNGSATAYPVEPAAKPKGQP